MWKIPKKSIHSKWKIYKGYKKLETKTIKSKRKCYCKCYYNFKLTPKKRELWKKWSENLNLIHSTLPHKIVIDKNVIFEEKQIAYACNNFYINISPNLADDIPTATRSFESYVQKTNEAIKDETMTINELKDAFFSPK